MADATLWLLVMLLPALVAVAYVALSRRGGSARMILVVIGAALVIVYIVWNLACRPGI